MLDKANIRCEVDDRNEKLGYRLREAQTKKIKYTLILGDQEKDSQTVSYRLHGSRDTQNLSINDFITKINEEITSKSH